MKTKVSNSLSSYKMPGASALSKRKNQTAQSCVVCVLWVSVLRKEGSFRHHSNCISKYFLLKMPPLSKKSQPILLNYSTHTHTHTEILQEHSEVLAPEMWDWGSFCLPFKGFACTEMPWSVRASTLLQSISVFNSECKKALLD